MRRKSAALDHFRRITLLRCGRSHHNGASGHRHWARHRLHSTPRRRTHHSKASRCSHRRRYRNPCLAPHRWWVCKPHRLGRASYNPSFEHSPDACCLTRPHRYLAHTPLPAQVLSTVYVFAFSKPHQSIVFLSTCSPARPRTFKQTAKLMVGVSERRTG